MEETVFICPSLLGIEDMEENSQAMVTENLFHRCRASGMFFSTGLTTNLKPHRAQELISGIMQASNRLTM